MRCNTIGIEEVPLQESNRSRIEYSGIDQKKVQLVQKAFLLMIRGNAASTEMNDS